MVQAVKKMAIGRLPTVCVQLAAGLLLAACRTPAALETPDPAPPAVIPAPLNVERLDGSFRATAGMPVSSDGSPESRRVAGYFAGLVRRTRGWVLPVREQRDSRAPRGGIAFLLDAEAPAAPEAYALTIRPGGVTVSARDHRGLLYGAVTLWQLIGTGPGDAGPVSLPAMDIADEPRFRWRGVMIDSARHYQSPEFLERFIDWMALHKLNVLHWHLTDDQGWRLEIRKYPRLTEVGAWRVPAGATETYGGYYSQDVVRRIVRHAEERNVTIVPEIDVPGHATAALVAYPWLGVDGSAHAAVPADWGVYPNLFNVEDRTFEFMEDVLQEVLALFPGEYIHVGGDEAVKDQWRSSPRVQQLMRERGIPDEHALQSYFIQRIGRFLSARGRRLIGWDEILEGGLAPDATVMSWRGIEGALAAAAAGHDAVLSPWPTLYLDNRQSADVAEPPGRGRVISLEDVYRFNPMPDALAEGLRRHILGLQVNLWTEHMRTEERVQWMAVPRAAALAELGWSPPERLDFKGFRTRLESATGWYRALGYGFADTAFRAPPPAPARRRRSQELRTCSDKLVLNLEDDAPVHGERAVFLVDIMEPCWIFENADLSGITSIVATVGQFPFNFQIGKDRDAIRLRPPRSPEGELEIRIDGCTGELLAALPLAPAAGQTGVTRLPAATVAEHSGEHDLCLAFTGRGIDPMWAIESIELVE